MKFGHRQGGKSHRVLLRLESGPAPLWEIAEAVGVRGNAARKFWRLLAELRREGFVRRSLTGRYRLTPAGRAELDRLNAGSAPNIRVFQIEEKAA